MARVKKRHSVTQGLCLMWLIIGIPVVGRADYDACTVLSTDEIKAALGRADLGAPRPSRASGGHSDCRFPGKGLGDVSVTLTPHQKSTAEDFALTAEILKVEGKTFERIPTVGDGAYYWEDILRFRVGDRIGTLWINRTARTEAPPAVKTALTILAKRAAERIRAASH